MKRHPSPHVEFVVADLMHNRGILNQMRAVHSMIETSLDHFDGREVPVVMAALRYAKGRLSKSIDELMLAIEVDRSTY